MALHIHVLMSEKNIQKKGPRRYRSLLETTIFVCFIEFEKRCYDMFAASWMFHAIVKFPIAVVHQVWWTTIVFLKVFKLCLRDICFDIQYNTADHRAKQ